MLTRLRASILADILSHMVAMKYLDKELKLVLSRNVC